ncbi:hypothetical protein TNCV_1409841 [Trichonephila clavipes]|uniref:Uncharacterized protein n=1 Tax=Trichonephila clavipes TaxID=2585209 RepID=A0A8X6RBW6_TRICX|nr:hypothetical protein TNCV_1409841 [Trichonephila clavipes]
MASAECMGGPRAPTPQRCSAGCSVYRPCVLEGCDSEIPYHLKPGYRVLDQQKRDSSVNTMSFHSVVYVRRSSHHWWRKSLWFPVKGKRSNGRLADTLHSRMLSSDLFSVWFGNSSNDHQARRRFVEWAQNEFAVVPDFHKRILFSEEAHFWLNGYVNKQNCRIWSEANP